MRYFLIGTILFFVGGRCLAQNSLPVDERGKYIYYEIVESKGTDKSSLTARVQHFFNNTPSLALKSSVADTLFNGEGKFVVSRSVAVLSHPSGEVRYNFMAEIKDGKYRYWLTDFRFIPYQRDRYGNFVPATTISTPLEKSPGKLNASEWKSNIEAIAGQAKKFGEKFKEQMSTPVQIKPEENKIKSISTSQW